MSSETVLQRIEPLRAPLPAPLAIRPLQLRDRAPLHQLLTKDGLFTREEIAVALELIDGALAEPGGEYRVLVAERAGVGASLAGYVCYGPTPMTEGTWDLYWIVTHPDARKSGVARGLVGRMEAEARAAGARLVRVETSHLDGYGAARSFYERLQYPVCAVLPDFYRPGDDLLVILKRL
jgi:ribosomal protein S18 acetylase RimI-like enzyme